MDLSAARPVDSAKRPRGRPRKTVEDRDDGNRRGELLRSAARLFRRKGFDATSTRDIAAAVGMQSGSPVLSLQEQGRAAVRRDGRGHAFGHRAAAAGAAARAGRPRPTPRRQLRILIRNHFDMLLGPGSDFIPVMLYEARSITPRQRAALAELQSEYEAPWIPVLRRAACLGPAAGRREAGAPADVRRAELVGAVVRPAQGGVAG